MTVNLTRFTPDAFNTTAMLLPSLNITIYFRIIIYYYFLLYRKYHLEAGRKILLFLKVPPD